MLERKESSVTIFRGDDTGGQLGKTIVINFHCGDTVNMEGVVVTFVLGGFYEKEFHNVHDGDRLEIFMTHEQTAMLPLGVSFGKLYGTDASGKIRTFSNRIPIRVTNRVCEAYGSAEESEIDVTISNAITWDSIIGKPETFPPSEHRHQKSDIDNLESDLKTLSNGVESAIEAAEAAKTEAEKGVRTVNSKAPTNGNVKIVLDDLADKDGNIETTKNIMVSRDGGETHAAVALYSDLISEINTHNNNEAAHPELMSTVARVFATKTEVEAKADKSALQAEVNRAQTAETQLTTKAEDAQTAANLAQNTADEAQNTANVASDKADAVYAELANKLDKTAFADHTENTNNPHNVTAAQVGAVSISRSPDSDQTFDWSPSGVDSNIRLFGTFYKTGIGLGLWSGGGSLFNYHDDTSDIYQFPTGESGTLALTSDIEDAVKNKADRASLAPEYSPSAAYPVGSIVYHDGNIYQCTTAIADGGEAWNAAHWEMMKLSDFFTESNSLLTATIDAEVISKGTAPDAHLEAPTDEHLKLILADNSVAYDSAKALPYKLTSVIGDRVIATMTLTAASTDITLPTIAANDTTVKDFILDVTNAYAVEGVATDAGINIPRTDFKLVTRDGESLTDVTTVKAGKSAFLCFTQKAPVVVGGTTYPCWCVIQLPFGDPS